MSKNFKDDGRKLIDGHIKKIKEGKAKIFSEHFLGMPQAQKDEDKNTIKQWLIQMKPFQIKIIMLALHIKPFVPDITEKSRTAAAYLLINSAISKLSAIFELQKGGFHHEIIELDRSIDEALGLISLFLTADNDKKLMKWFDGSIITNGESREQEKKYFGKIEEMKSLPVKELSSYLYTAKSSFSHSSYTGLLESVDPYNHDYDYGRYSGFHRVAESLRNIQHGSIIGILTSMRFIYLHLKLSHLDDQITSTMKDLGYREDLDEMNNILGEFRE